MRPWPRALRLVLAIVICAASGGTARAGAGVEVLDDAGRRIRLASPAQRIVSLSPHLTELLFDAGAGGRVVGAAEFSDHPEAAKRIPRIGDARGLDLERIVALRPDLVLAWRSGNSRRTVDRLRRLGVAVYESEPTRLEDIASTLDRLGALAGSRDQARVQADGYRARLADIVGRHAGMSRLRIFYQVWERPLLTVDRQHIIGDAFAVCGAVGVFARLPAITSSPSREAVLLADPDVIVVADASPRAAEAWTRWKQLRAVRSGRVVSVDPERLHRPTLRMLDAVEDLCRRIR